MPVQYVYPEIYNSGSSMYPSVQPSYYQGWVNNGSGNAKWYFSPYTLGTQVLPNNTILDQINEGVASVDYSGHIHLGFDSSWASSYPNTNYFSLKTNKCYINPTNVTFNLRTSGEFTHIGGSPIPPVIATCAVFDERNNILARGDFPLRSGIHTISTELNFAQGITSPEKLNFHVDNIRYSGTSSAFLRTNYKIYAMDLLLSGNQLIDKELTLNMFGDVNLTKNHNIAYFDEDTGYYNNSLFPSLVYLPHSCENYTTNFDRGSIYDMGLYNFVRSGQTTSSGTFMYNTSGTNFCLAYPVAHQMYDGRFNDSGAIRRTVSVIPGISYLEDSPGLTNYESGLDTFLDFYSYQNQVSPQRYCQGNAIYNGTSLITESHGTDGSYYKQHTTNRHIDFYNLIPTSGDFSIYINMGDIAFVEDENYYRGPDGEENPYYQPYTSYLQDIVVNDRFKLRVFKDNYSIYFGAPSYYMTFYLRDELTGLQDEYQLPLISNFGFNDYNGVPRIKSFVINYENNVMDVNALFYGIDGFNKILSLPMTGVINPSGYVSMPGAETTRFIFEVGGKSGVTSAQQISTLHDSIVAPINAIPHDITLWDSGTYAYINYPEIARKNYSGPSNSEKGDDFSNEIGKFTRHYLSNYLLPNDSKVYQVVPNSDMFVKMVVEYTGTHPSGLYIIPAMIEDGNYDRMQYTASGQFLKNTGIQTLVFSGQYQSSDPYPFKVGAGTPRMAIKVASPALSGTTPLTFSGGQFRVYALEMSADILETDPTGTIGNVTLFTQGYEPTTGDITLYLEAEEKLDTLKLFIEGTGGEVTKGVPLTVWTTGSSSGTTTSVTTLHTYSAIPTSGDLNLWIGAPLSGSYTTGLNLFLEQDGFRESGIPLTVWNNIPSAVNNSITLFTTSYGEASGLAPLYLEATYGLGAIANSEFNLFLHSKAPSGVLDLFVYNEVIPNSGSTTLYTKSASSDYLDMPLFIEGGGIDIRSGEITLHVSNYATANSGIPLFTIGNESFGSINLYTSSEDTPVLSGNTDLFIFSALDSGVYNSLELYVESIGNNASVPLTITAPNIGFGDSALNLYVLNDTVREKNVLLYVENNASGLTNSAKLFVQGNGLYEGAGSINDNLNLFINRGNDSVANIVELYIKTSEGVVSGVPMVTNGGTITNNSVYLNVPSVSGPKSGDVTMYVHGF